MPEASEYTPSRALAGVEVPVNQTTAPIPSKSFVVPRYDPYGQRLSKGETVGGDQIASKHRQALVSSMRTNGRVMRGYVMTENGPVKQAQAPTAPVNKPGKKAKSKTVIKPAQPLIAETITETVTPYEDVVKPLPQAKSIFLVTFVIASGKIKSSVNAVLESKEALLLVYEDEDSISYIPEKGSKFTIITPDRREVPVLYLGLQFEWYNSRQQLLIFLKTDVDEWDCANYDSCYNNTYMITANTLCDMAKYAELEEVEPVERKKPLRNAIDTAKDIGAGAVGGVVGAFNSIKSLDKPAPVVSLPEKAWDYGKEWNGNHR